MSSELLLSNGVYWYNFRGKSFGFSPNSKITLEPGDTTDDTETNDRRLSWLIDTTEHEGRNRAGSSFDPTDYYKVIYTSDHNYPSGILMEYALSILEGRDLIPCMMKKYEDSISQDDLKHCVSDIPNS